MSEREIYIVEAKRTAIGSFMGSLASVPAHKLGEIVIKELIKKDYMHDQEISQIIMGQVLTGGVGQNPARQASINAGVSFTTPAWTVNQVCGSGLRAVIEAAKSIITGEGDLIIAGGQENMSASGHMSYLRQPTKMGDCKSIDMMITDGLTDAFNHYHMGITAENVAKKFNITREEQDEFAFQSQMKASNAQKQGKFDSQIVAVEIEEKKQKISFAKDESIRENTNLETLKLLKPAFEKNSGTVTAGNSSGLNDGAAAVILMSGEKMRSLGLKPLAKIKSWASVGVEPEIMGTGPIPTVKKALKLANWQLEDLDLIESNEAFAVQSLAVSKALAWDVNKVNVNGGAVALGHPIGASGARVLVTLLHEMQARSARKALATLCIGGGMGIAICLER